MSEEHREALQNAVEAFKEDREARSDAVEARRNFIAACVDAHVVGVSDQQLATAFGDYSRARIQQLRAKGDS